MFQQVPNDHEEDDERFSVAPMMGHTTRHYRYFWRLLSRHATLYTEMIPSSTIVQAFKYESERILGEQKLDSYDCIPQVLEKLRDERQRHPEFPITTLERLLRDDTSDGKVVLQLGGRDPQTLAMAAAIGTAYLSTGHQPHTDNAHAYAGVNLNCGCPSTSVAAGRRTGAALMLEPLHVVQCLNAMTEAMNEVASLSLIPTKTPALSVKHRLGVWDANEYQQRKRELQSTGRYSLKKEEEEAYRSCHDFVSQILTSSYSNHNLSRIQVHARLALLGLDQAAIQSSSPIPPLWVASNDNKSPVADETIKINHQRVQYRAKQQARQATIDNRLIPPLHPNVAAAIASDFSSSRLQVVTNGGIQSLDDVKQRLDPINRVHGAMVGRCAINHPCAFASVDVHLFESEDATGRCKSRRQVLERYIQYCETQEEENFQRQALTSKHDDTNDDICSFRKELVAPAFHLFVGEEGNAVYQRLMKRLTSRAQRHSSTQILQAAMAQVPSVSLDKPVEEHLPWNQVQIGFQEKHGEAALSGTKRSGAMQKIVY